MIVHLSEKEMEVMITKSNDNTEEPTSHPILRYPSQNGRKWERFKPNIDHSLRHQMQSQKILFTPNPSSKIF